MIHTLGPTVFDTVLVSFHVGEKRISRLDKQVPKC